MSSRNAESTIETKVEELMVVDLTIEDLVVNLWNSLSAGNETRDNEVLRKLFSDIDTIDAIKGMNRLKTIKESMEARMKSVNFLYDFFRLELIPTKFEDEGIERISVDGVGRVSLTGDMYVSVFKGKKEEFYEFLRDIGKGDLITESVNPSTLKAVVKQMISNGDELPDDLVKVTPFTRASITSSK